MSIYLGLVVGEYMSERMNHKCANDPVNKWLIRVCFVLFGYIIYDYLYKNKFILL